MAFPLFHVPLVMPLMGIFRCSSDYAGGKGIVIVGECREGVKLALFLVDQILFRLDHGRKHHPLHHAHGSRVGAIAPFLLHLAY